jgi:hypothetical protein
MHMSGTWYGWYAADIDPPEFYKPTPDPPLNRTIYWFNVVTYTLFIYQQKSGWEICYVREGEGYGWSHKVWSKLWDNRDIWLDLPTGTTRAMLFPGRTNDRDEVLERIAKSY